MSRSSISGSDVSYVFSDGEALFGPLNFSFSAGRHALVGNNGVGKSTFLRLLSGDLPPSSGHLIRAGTVACFSLEAFAPLDTVGDILPGLWESSGAMRRLLLGLEVHEINPARGMGTLSSGEQVRVTLAKALLQEPDILILDEPTNHLDGEGRRVMERLVKQWRGCLIVVSHDRELLSHVDAVYELSRLGLKAYGGNFSAYLEARQSEERRTQELISHFSVQVRRERDELRQSVERQTRRMQRGKKEARRGGVPKILAGMQKRRAQKTLARGRAVHEDRVLQASVGLRSAKDQARDEDQIRLDLPETELPVGKLCLVAREFNFRFHDSVQTMFASPISFELVGPERVALVGRNGGGKTTLLKLLLGSRYVGTEVPVGFAQGELALKLERVACLDQNLNQVDDTLTVLANLRRSAPGLSESEVRIRLGRLLFAREAMDRPAGRLSHGERARLALGCILFSTEAPQLLVLDEPTNHLDIASVQRMESALSGYRGALLVVSHDKHFLQHLQIDRVIDLDAARARGSHQR